MNCPNCNQPYEAGLALCPNCGSPLPTTAEPIVPPAPVTPLPTTPMPPPAATLPTYTLPSSSGLATASLILGIIGLVLIAACIALVIKLSADVLNFVGDAAQYMSERELQEYISQYAQQYAQQNTGLLVGLYGSGILALLAALVGLILGIVGLSQERNRPTQSGRTHSIVGIVLSSLPLLCCVVIFAIGLIAMASGLGG